ncbi:hypothetical protein O181_028608 [Austropuccinia psidii MF-1]|uniref:Uncharacterized protein n=1 Tax=Austropuccinia psidii MF-1 TaxID=1389203 RepID=A0A9Q3CU49_9BASI|nr:hypothetical protein [Austropuccinia psidii MF-1]
MEHGQQEVQHSFMLGRSWRRLPEDMSQIDKLQRSCVNNQRMESQQAVKTPGGKRSQDNGESSHCPSHRRTTELDRAYSDSFKLTRSKPTRLLSGFTPFRHQQISDKESQSFKVPGSLQEKTRIEGENETFLNQRQKDSDPMIQKLLYLAKELHKSQK